MSNEYKIIHAYVNDPTTNIFKSQRNGKAECTILSCSNSENCGMYKRGECTMLAIISGDRCPYGKKSFEKGFTPKANNFRRWIKDRRELYKDYLGKLSYPTNVMARVGDYVYLPYSLIEMNESVPFLSKSGFMLSGNRFLLFENFTIKNIISICDFRPMALFAYEEITAYQEKSVPNFLLHLSEVFPEIYAELSTTYPRAARIVKSLTHKGREAVLKTLNPNVGAFVDIHGASWVWDGEFLTSTNSKASFMIVNKFSEIRVKPNDNCKIVITDEAQVNKDTVFLT